MDNVIVLFPRGRAQDISQSPSPAQSTAQSPAQSPEATVNGDTPAPSLEKTDFQIIAERNATLRDKLRKEREQANKSVLKSYRIK